MRFKKQNIKLSEIVRIRSFIFLFLILLLSACGVRDPLFNIGSRTDFSVSLGLSIIESHFFVKDNVSIPIELSMSNLGFVEGDIAEIVPFAAFLRPKFGDNVDLDFINRVNVFIVDQDDFRKKEIFYLDFVQIGSKTEIELIPTLIDIKDLVINDRAIIEVRLDLRQFPPATFDMQVDMEFAGFATE